MQQKSDKLAQAKLKLKNFQQKIKSANASFLSDLQDDTPIDANTNLLHGLAYKESDPGSPRYAQDLQPKFSSAGTFQYTNSEPLESDYARHNGHSSQDYYNTQVNNEYSQQLLELEAKYNYSIEENSNLNEIIRYILTHRKTP
jgi:hypothetical protein